MNYSNLKIRNFTTKSLLTNNVVNIFGTLPRALNGLMREMDRSLVTPNNKSVRLFRSYFCRKVREFRGLSFVQLHGLLELHPQMKEFCERFPSIKNGSYLITPQFIQQFEENLQSIPEFCRFGFLGGGGFPSYEFTQLIADVCNAKEEHQNFEKIYLKLESKKLFSSFRR